MKKIVLLSLIVFYLFLFKLEGFAVSESPSPSLAPFGDSKALSRDTKPKYMEYYVVNYDNQNVNMVFIPLNKDGEKQLEKSKLKEYKEYKKYNKWLKQYKFEKVYKRNDTYLPLYTEAYKYNKQLNNLKGAIRNLEYLLAIDKYDIIDRDFIKLNLAWDYYTNRDYQKALDLYLPLYANFNNKNNVFLIANCYFYLKDYDNAIKYLKLSKSKDEEEWKNELLYFSYYNKGNKAEAHKYALLALNKTKNYTNYLRAADSTDDKGKQLNWYYKAKQHSTTDDELIYCNVAILKLEDEKIRNIAKNIKGYFIAPQWAEILKRDIKYMSFYETDKRQTDFYTSIHNCTNNYTGNDLKACLTDIQVKEDKYSEKLVADYRYKQQQLLELERINQLQQMNANLQYSNYLQNQQNMILNRPRYTNSTTSRYGNTYYTNSYSY